MFDLNASEFKGTSIFNGGVAGLVRNVEIKVEKKVGEGNTPDYKLIVNDPSGSINVGFYYFVPNPKKNEEDNKKYESMQVSRVVHIAHAVLGNDYKLPQVQTSKEAFDVLFKLISENCTNKKFNIYATYGTVARPSKYLGLRFFNFIEPFTEGNSSLRANVNDLLERVEEDSQDELSELNSTKEGKFIL